MCGERMELSVREVQDRVPGRAEPRPRQVREWVCAECDYFEEAEGGED